MFIGKPTSRFNLYTLITLFLLLSCTIFICASEDSNFDTDNEDELEELIAIDEQREDQLNVQQQGEQLKEAEMLSKAQRMVLELNSDNAKKVIDGNEFVMVRKKTGTPVIRLDSVDEAAEFLKKYHSFVLGLFEKFEGPDYREFVKAATSDNEIQFVAVTDLAVAKVFFQDIKAKKHSIGLLKAEPEITVNSLIVNNFFVGEGTDFSGVPTKMLTLNGSLTMSIYNPTTKFGIYVSSTPIELIFSEIPVATGQLKKYYQPRKSHRSVSVIVQGNRVPLYGAGSSLPVQQTGIRIPLTLKFEINVVGKLVRTKKKLITCPVVIDSKSSKPIKFKRHTCTYE